MEYHLTATLLIQPFCCHGPLILVRTKAWSNIFFKNPFNTTTLTMRPNLCGAFVTILTGFPLLGAWVQLLLEIHEILKWG